ncbi:MULTISPECIES: hypothetical protein [Empedobacter]|uniref:hypothetical protein n=1 Tax=Empedobacter TaxID=59734 RepID=UPI002575871C|nr:MULTISPECIES: hypothetical protein [Empedobacter]MDM1041692.1 hypothetical protein [Empedobacter brevis]MDM1135174.1 hypothetical protein [Empedobacter sp. R750]
MWKTIEFYQRTNIINMSYRTIMRQLGSISGDINIVKKKVIEGRETWQINYDYIHEYFQRKRKVKSNEEGFNQRMEKKVRRVISTLTVPEDVSQYNIELGINFKDDYDRNYYDYIVKDLFIRSEFDIFYVIEEDSSGFNHLHVGLKGDPEELKLVLKHTYDNLHLHDYDGEEENLFSKQTNVAIIRNQNAYLDYLKKDGNIEFLLKRNNLKLFEDGRKF